MSRTRTLTFSGACLAGLLAGCATPSTSAPDANSVAASGDDLLVVDCLLPSQVRKLGQKLTFLAPRRAIKTSGVDCEIRGGEYVSYDRSNYATALKVWLPQAQAGDAAAQTYVGEIYEKGLGLSADYQIAAQWYQKAAQQNESRAMINLGYLYESGLGVSQDLVTAMNWYRKASGLSDGNLEYVSSVEVANRRAAQQERVALRQEVGELRSQLSQTQELVTSRKVALERSQQEYAALSKRLEDQRRMAAAPASAVAAVPTRGAPDQESLRRAELAEGQLLEAQKDREALREQLRQAQAELDGRSRALQVAQTDVAQTRSELERLRRSADAQDKAPEIERLAAQLEEREAAVAARDREVSELQTRLAQTKTQLADARGQLAATTAESESERSALEAELRDAKFQQKRLTAELEAQQREAQVMRAELARSQTQLDARRQQLALALSEASDTRTELERARQLTDSTDKAAETERLEAQLNEREAVVKTQRQEMAWLESEMQEQREALTKDLEAAQRRERELDQALASRNEEASVLQQQLAEAREQLVVSASVDVKLTELEQDLKRREAEIERQKSEISELQSKAERERTAVENTTAASSVVAAVPAGPTIEIIAPPLALTRGKPSVKLRSVVPNIDVIGRVTAEAGLLSLSVNDRTQDLENVRHLRGLFRAKIPVKEADTPVNVIAVDKAGNRSEVDFLLIPESAKKTVAESPSSEDKGKQPSSVDFGNYHALVIGNNQYPNLPNLRTAKNDAKAVAQVLESKYGFKTTLLLDANRYAILSALNGLREKLTEKDNLVIYYGGHGELDQANLRGHWLPVDAEPDSTANWISNVAITDILNSMSAKHILVVADSCYSGALTRSSLAQLQAGMSNDARSKWFKTMSQARARTVLTSGGLKPVLDSGGGSDHSVFAKAFLDVLNENNTVLEGFALYREVQKRVKSATATFREPQDPQYAPIKYAGHEAGEFFLVPSGTVTRNGPAPSLIAQVD